MIQQTQVALGGISDAVGSQPKSCMRTTAFLWSDQVDLLLRLWQVQLPAVLPTRRSRVAAQHNVKAELAKVLEEMFDNPESVFYLNTEEWSHKMHPWSLGMVLLHLALLVVRGALKHP